MQRSLPATSGARLVPLVSLFLLGAFPALAVWQPNQVVGPIDQFINNPESTFWNMWAWSKP